LAACTARSTFICSRRRVDRSTRTRASTTQRHRYCRRIAKSTHGSTLDRDTRLVAWRAFVARRNAAPPSADSHSRPPRALPSLSRNACSASPPDGSPPCSTGRRHRAREGGRQVESRSACTRLRRPGSPLCSRDTRSSRLPPGACLRTSSRRIDRRDPIGDLRPRAYMTAAPELFAPDESRHA
jgi:hypothetical protein